MLSKRETLIFGAMLILQIILILSADRLLAAIVPPVLAAIPDGIATLRSEQRLRLMAQRPSRLVRTVAIFGIAGTAMFVFEGTEPSFKFQLLRALLVDVAILGLGCLIVVQFHLARKRQMGTVR